MLQSGRYNSRHVLAGGELLYRQGSRHIQQQPEQEGRRSPEQAYKTETDGPGAASLR